MRKTCSMNNQTARLILLCALLCLAAPVVNAALLFHVDFENGKILSEGDYGAGVERCCDHSVTVVDERARKGDKSVRFESRRDDPLVAGSPGRAELKVKKTSPIVEEWYAWSIFVPVEMKPDIPEILGQWHASPDFDKGEDWRSPPMAVAMKDGRWDVSGHYAPQEVNSNRDRKKGFSEDLGEAARGVWTDWIFHVSWDYRETEQGGGGFVKGWRQVDGGGYEAVIDYKGPIGYNDERGVYFKWGIYKWPWKNEPGNQSPRVVYYDEIKIGDQTASFDEMKVVD